jgi:hypothetical protein
MIIDKTIKPVFKIPHQIFTAINDIFGGNVYNKSASARLST